MVSMKKNFWGISILLVIGINSISQEINKNPLWIKEQKVKEYFDKIYVSPTDADKIAYNDSVTVLLEEIIKMQGSFQYPFDSLQRMGKIVSPDKKFRLYNWNLSYLNGTHDYFCFMQKYSKEKKDYIIYSLIDKSEEIKNIESAVLDQNHWFGALYYKIIPVKFKKKEYYMLLGLDLNNFLTTKKIIEPMQFDDNGNIRFGLDVFNVDRKKKKRMVFEYSSNATMSLNTIENDKIILFDHLSPIRSDLKDKYEHYGPDFSYDALKLKKGVWEYISDFDARNNE